MTQVDTIVLGGGPSGLGAALALAREGHAVRLIEGADEVGGLCRTRVRDGHSYDVGGHIPFVNDDRRREWLHELMDGDLHWVDQPVSCVRDGEIARGRYLDQRPAAPGELSEPDSSAAGLLGGRFGRDFVDQTMRPYLEKIDGVALEMIPAERALKLLESQAAPEGFWFPGGGIGRLMDAMARAVIAAGGHLDTDTRATAIHRDGNGRVSGASFEGPTGAGRAECRHLVVATPAAVAARLLEGSADPLPDVRMRAVTIACLEFDTPRLSDRTWTQVDDPTVAFSRAFEPGNWSQRMAPEGRTMLGLECYSRPSDDDPIWSASDGELAERCATDLARLGWCDPDTPWRTLEMIRMRAAYPEFSRDQLPAIAEPRARLEAIPGIHLAPGSAVVEAIEAGEAAAEAITDGRLAA